MIIDRDDTHVADLLEEAVTGEMTVDAIVAIEVEVATAETGAEAAIDTTTAEDDAPDPMIDIVPEIVIDETIGDAMTETETDLTRGETTDGTEDLPHSRKTALYPKRDL